MCIVFGLSRPSTELRAALRFSKGQTRTGPPEGGHYIRRVLLSFVAIAALTLGATACNNNSATTATTPTTPTVARTTDTFSGTVPVGGNDFHSFTMSATGPIDVTLTAAAPPAAVVVGISLGLPSSGQCTSLAGGTVNTAAGTTAQLSGVASPTTLCVNVRDVSNQTAPVAYTVTVLHP